MNITHITPHLGGGVGRVLISWLGREHEKNHTVYCLETVSAEQKKKAEKADVAVHSQMSEDLPGLMTAIESANVVLVHWWNNPGLYRLLVNERLPPCRLVVWSHVAGHTAPQIFTKNLVTYPDRFAVATPWSLESPVITALDPSWRNGHVRQVFTCAGIERGEQVRCAAHDGFVVGYVGTVDFCKLHPSFISMSAAADIPGGRFIVCGGERHEELREQARTGGFAGRFTFTGPIENVPDYLGTFDVFGYPLRRDHYGTGEQALIEAMAAGLPVVVFDNGSERHLVEDNETGLVVKTEQEYSAALEKLYRDPALRKRLGRRARETAAERFSLDAMVKAWRGLLQETAALPKKEHAWPGGRPLHGAALFVESLGDAAEAFRHSMSGDSHAPAAETAIATLTGAHRATTRGSVFHYRDQYPEDPHLNLWCGLLERAMGDEQGAEQSFAAARKNGIERAPQQRSSSITVAESAHNFIHTDRPCPLCGGFETTLLTRLKFALFEDNPLAPEFPWVICNKCGFSYYATPSKPALFDDYYTANAYYVSAATSGSGSSNAADVKRYDAIAECLCRHVGDRTFPVFDVGSGKGGLLERLEANGFSNLFAVDMVPGCVDYVRKNSGFQAATGSASRLPFMSITPHVLIYSHVLEHVYDPGSILDEAHHRLADNGFIYLETPDAGRYGEYQKIPWADLYFEHINHFDETHLVGMTEAHGFKKVETGSRLLDTARGNVVPCIYGVFQKDRQKCRNCESDQRLAARLREYVERCGRSALVERLEQLAKTKTPVYVWGMSQFGQLLLGQTALCRCAIKALVDGDKNKQGKKILGMTILSPETLRNASKEDLVVLTGTGYQKQMREYLKTIGFKGSEYVLE